MFKLVCRLPDGLLKKILKRLRLYHPPLHRLQALSQGSEASLVSRSKEFSELLEDVIINGVWKRTGLARLIVLDQWVIPFIEGRPISESLAMLDVGASDGSTTFDTVTYFQENLKAPVKATILEMQLRLHYFHRWGIRYYLTYDQIPLLIQIGLWGILFEEIKAKEGFIFNPIIRLTKKFLQRHRLEKYMRQAEDLLLENPLARNNSAIVWLEQNLFNFDPTLVGTFDFIRCCNVLNCGYFTEGQIADALQILVSYLKPKGLLLVSRTVDDATGPVHTASLWEKTTVGLAYVSQLNGGSEVKAIAEKSLQKMNNIS